MLVQSERGAHGRWECKGYDSESSLDGVGEEQTQGSVDLLILLLDVLGNLFQYLINHGHETHR